MPRIIAGGRKGRRLQVPRGTKTRPTGARVKQSLFDILGPRLPAARFLDLFAGGGTIGLEAASRGAARVVLVEHDRRAADAIRHNATLLDPPSEVVVRPGDCLRVLEALARQAARFDIVFLDPPYESDLYEPVLRALDALALCEASGLIVAEHFHKRPLPERIGALESVRSVRIGDHCLTFYGRGAGEPREKEET